MKQMEQQQQPMLWGIGRLAARWDLSQEFIRRLIVEGQLQTVRMGARRLVPLSEIERAERFGVGPLRPLNHAKVDDQK